MDNDLISQALLQQEWGGDDDAPTSVDGAQGKGQITPDTFARYAQPGEDISNKKDNLAVHHRIVADLSSKFNGDPSRIAVGYFSGPGNVAPPDSPTPWIHDRQDGTGKKVSEYVSDVMGRLNPKVQVGPQEQVAMSTTQPVDPIEQALSAEKNLPANSIDPIEHALSSPTIDPIEQALGGQVAPQEEPAQLTPLQKLEEKQKGSYLTDISNSLPGAVVKGVGAIPQIPAYATNLAAQAGGYAYGRLHNLFSSTPYDQPTLDKLANIQPVYTGATPLEQAARVTEGLSGQFQPGEIENQKIGSENYLPEPQTLPGKLVSAGIQGAVAGPAVGAGAGISAASGALGQAAHEAYPNNPIATLMAGSLPFGAKGAYDLGTNQLGKGAQAQADFPTNKIFEAAQRDLGPNTTVQDIQAKLKDLGPNATLADLGPNSRDLAYVTAQTPGKGAEIAESGLESRQAGQVDRITQAATKGLNVNPGDTYNKVLSSLDNTQKTQAAPLYKEAYQNNPNIADPVIDRILDTEAGKAALEFARKRMNNRMSLMATPDPDLAEQAKLTGQYQSGGIASGLKLQTLDLVKQGFDDQYQALARKGENGAAGDILDLKKGLVGRLDSLDTTGYDAKGNPLPGGGKYAQARAAYAEPAQAKEALDAGYDYIGKGGNADPDSLKDLTDAQKPYFKIGAANKLKDMIQDTRYGADAAKKVLKSPAQEKALSALFDSPSEFDDFKKTVNNEAEYYKTKYNVLGNSLTEPRMAARDDANLTPGQKALKTGAEILSKGYPFLTNNFAGKLIYGGQLAHNMLTKPQSLTPETSEAMANMQFSPGGANEFVNAYKQYLAKKLATPSYLQNALTFPGSKNLVINSINSQNQ